MLESFQNWDMQVLLWVAQFQNPILLWAASILSLLSAKAATVWLLIPAMWATRHRALAFRILMALVTTAILGFIVKYTVQRHRPDVYAALQAHKPIPEYLTTHYSFPSGHVLGFATAAVVITHCCKRRTAVVFWIFTLLVCWARVYDKMHFPTDCLGGFILGIAFASISEWLWSKGFPDRILNSPIAQRLAQRVFLLKLPIYIVKCAREDDRQRYGSDAEKLPAKPATRDLQPVK